MREHSAGSNKTDADILFNDLVGDALVEIPCMIERPDHFLNVTHFSVLVLILKGNFVIMIALPVTNPDTLS